MWWNAYAFAVNGVFGAIMFGALAGAVGVAADYGLGDEFHPLASFTEWGTGGALVGAFAGLGRVTNQYYRG